MNQQLITTSCANLSQYINVVRSIPILSVEREQELVNDLSVDNKKLLAYHHLNLVVSIASKYTTKDFNDMGDLIQAGNIGLMKGISKFDGSFGVRVSTYVAFHIRNEICDWIVCNWSPVKIATTKDQRKIFFNMSKVRRAMSDQEQAHLADTLGVDINELKEMQKRLSGRHGNISFESAMDDSEDEFSMLDKELLEHSEVDLQKDNAITLIDNQQREQLIRKCIDTLNERQKEIIVSRYLSDEPKTLNELADKYGVSQQRVSQIEKDAVKALRAKLASVGLEMC